MVAADAAAGSTAVAAAGAASATSRSDRMRKVKVSFHDYRVTHRCLLVSVRFVFARVLAAKMGT
jgi:hypothetical protein